MSPKGRKPVSQYEAVQEVSESSDREEEEVEEEQEEEEEISASKSAGNMQGGAWARRHKALPSPRQILNTTPHQQHQQRSSTKPVSSRLPGTATQTNDLQRLRDHRVWHSRESDASPERVAQRNIGNMFGSWAAKHVDQRGTHHQQLQEEEEQSQNSEQEVEDEQHEWAQQQRGRNRDKHTPPQQQPRPRGRPQSADVPSNLHREVNITLQGSTRYVPRCLI
jgi:hypothetical protein